VIEPAPSSAPAPQPGHGTARAARGADRPAGTHRPGHPPPGRLAGPTPPRHLRRQRRPNRGLPVATLRQPQRKDQM